MSLFASKCKKSVVYIVKSAAFELSLFVAFISCMKAFFLSLDSFLICTLTAVLFLILTFAARSPVNTLGVHGYRANYADYAI